jgi:hypothetical protein
MVDVGLWKVTTIREISHRMHQSTPSPNRKRSPNFFRLLFVSWELRLIEYECRCDERLKVEGSTRLTYTGLCGGLEHLKIETRLIDERFPSVMSLF